MKRLNGWKEIAAHLKLGVRTVQRWEKLGLPIRRPYPARRRGMVIGFGEELDKWERGITVSMLDKIEVLQAKVNALRRELRLLKSERKRRVQDG